VAETRSGHDTASEARRTLFFRNSRHGTLLPNFATISLHQFARLIENRASVFLDSRIQADIYTEGYSPLSLTHWAS